MKPIRLFLAFATGLLAFPLFAQPPAPRTEAAPPAPDHVKDSAWLCLPGRDDACSRPLGTAALNPNGYGSVGQVRPARDAAVDCFYIYPTVSRDRGLNSDLTPGREEQGSATVQLARFGTVCRTFAPLYRQVTLAALPLAFLGRDVQANFDLAYGDVLAAWREFLAHRNANRPFVLIGHSQGSIHLLRLLQQEIEGKPVAKRMLSAILLGWAVEVPEGKLVGGSLKSTPLCSREGQTGCVITYMSFRASSPPPEGSLLGRATHPGMTAGCTHPAALARGGPARLDSYWFALMPAQAGEAPITWSTQGPPSTPFLRTEGLVTATCVHKGRAGYLAVTVNADPADPRTDRIPGDVYLLGRPNAGWGLHTTDMSLAQGDLIRLVEAQARTFAAASRRK